MGDALILTPGLSEASSSFGAEEPTQVAQITAFAPPFVGVPTRPRPPASSDESTHVSTRPTRPPGHDFGAEERTQVSGRHDSLRRSLASPPPRGPNAKGMPAIQDEFIAPMSFQDVSLALEETHDFLPISSPAPSDLTDLTDPYRATLSPSTLAPLYQRPTPAAPPPPAHDVPVVPSAPLPPQAPPVPRRHDPHSIPIPLKVEGSEWEEVIRQETRSKIDITALQRELFIASALGDPVEALEAEVSRIMNPVSPPKTPSRWPTEGQPRR